MTSIVSQYHYYEAFSTKRGSNFITSLKQIKGSKLNFSFMLVSCLSRKKSHLINLLNNGGKKNTVQLRQCEEAQDNEAEELLVIFY